MKKFKEAKVGDLIKFNETYFRGNKGIITNIDYRGYIWIFNLNKNFVDFWWSERFKLVQIEILERKLK